MGYDDGVQTGGINAKRNLPERDVYEREDIKFFHYARVKPQKVLKRKRQFYWSQRGVSWEEMESIINKDPFVTLDFAGKTAHYDGEIPEFVEQPELEIYENKKYIDELRDNYSNAILSFRQRCNELSPEDWVEAVDIQMRYGGKKTWDRDPDIYEKYLLEWILENKSIGNEEEVLDAGCGFGYLLSKFYEYDFRNLYGFDMSEFCINSAKERCDQFDVSLSLRHGDLKKTGYRDQQFGLIMCTEVLEHDKNPHLILKEIFRILKNGGVSFFSFPKMNKREAYSHINYFISGDVVVDEKTKKEFNVIDVDRLFRESWVTDYFVETIANDKFYIVWAYK
jgi:2-polyprenyl-3-methyl-5-hydroxy-6-metoxy-1,4-benzoquinol methylase